MINTYLFKFSSWLKLVKVEYIMKGFEEKLAPAEVHKHLEPLLEIANESVIINEDGDREVANQNLATKPSTLMANLNDETPLITTQKMI